MEKVSLSSGQLIRMHDKGTCSGPCPVHNPSEHHMRSFKLYWRDDRRIFERICEHGVGHPDPDTLAYLRTFKSEETVNSEAIHGCDGCCHPPEEQVGWRPDTI